MCHTVRCRETEAQKQRETQREWGEGDREREHVLHGAEAP